MTTKTLNLALVVIVSMLFGTLLLLLQKPWQAYGNVSPQEVMESTTTPSLADLTNLCPQGRNIASSTTGTLASVNITGAGTGKLLIIDATTSDVTLRANVATSSLILADFNFMSTTTNAFNLSFRRGLFVDQIGTVGTSTITYRCGS